MNGMERVLRLTLTGLPVAWLTHEEAATLYVKQQVVWSLGDQPYCMRGGINRLGVRSQLQLAPIIACSGDIQQHSFVPSLGNRLLFRRDHQRCMYCGHQFNHLELTRDHVIPRSHGGADIWTNVVAACKRCNQRKGARTPEQAHMQLLAIPFEPNVFEFMFLANRQIRGDQMEYLQSRFSGRRAWLRAG